ncbi:MAG: vWA domain-containing protein [Myxococcaceae bacterium]
MRHPSPWLAVFVVASAFTLATAACGRTEVVRYSVFPPDASVDAGRDAGPLPHDAGWTDAGCMNRIVPLVPAVPTVMFVLDRSGSMDEDLDGHDDAGFGNARWDVLQRSLGAVLPGLNQKIAMGALFYPVPGESCTVATNVDLTPRLNNAQALLSAFLTSGPLGGTPTSDALTTAAAHVLTIPTASSARALVLATDGAPNCNEFLDPNTCTCTAAPLFDPNCDGVTLCLDDRRTTTTLSNLFNNQKLPTYVIGLGSSLNMFSSTLDAMAVAGGVPRMGTGAKFYSATSQAELTDAFSRITAQLTRCTFLVTGLSINDTFTLRLDGQVVPEGVMGWEWLNRDRGEMVLHATACDRAVMGAQAQLVVDCH